MTSSTTFRIDFNKTKEEPSYITPEETSLIMETITEGTPQIQTIIEETPLIRTELPIKTESLVKEITINKPTLFTGDRTRVHQENNTLVGQLEMLECTRVARYTRSSYQNLKKNF